MTFHPNYELLEELGRGQTTVVSRGWDSALSRPIAVKQLQEQFQKDERRKQKFIEQGQFLANLSHENVLNVYSLEPKLGWIVMELMKGSMENKLREGPLSADLVRSVMRQSLQALVYLHDQGRIHGKIRPSNILIDEQGRVKLSDFETGDREGEIPVPKGEEKYVAPELFNPDFGAIGQQLDLYCLGFTALELLAGDRFNTLFPGVGEHTDTKTSWIRWHRSDEELKSTSELIRGLPSDLGQTIDRLLKKHVADRPTSAQEVLDMLTDTPDVSVELAPENSVSIPQAPQPSDQVEPPQRETRAPQPKREHQPNPPKKRPANKANTQSSSARPAEPFKFDLSDKRVFYPVAVVVLLLAAIVGLWLQAVMNPMIEVTIETSPKGATISDEEKELKPVKDSENTYKFSEGKHKLTFQAEGFVSLEREITVKKGMDKIPPISLAREVSQVTIVVDPPGASVKDGDTVIVPVAENGNVYELAPGTHTITVTKERFLSKSQAITVTNDPLVVPTITLDPVPPIDVAIVTDPAGATITRAGEKVATTDTGVYQLQPGEHELVFSKQGYLDLTKTVTVTKDQPISGIALDLAVTIPTKPAGTTILKDGKRLKPDKADGNVYGLLPGEHKLVFKKDGYLDLQKTITISEENAKVEDVVLNLAVTLVSNPAKVEVWEGELQIQPIETGGNAYALAPGTHQLVLRAEGFVDHIETFNIDEDKKRFEGIELASGVKVDIVTQPEEVAIRKSGQPVKLIEGTKYLLAVGKQDLTFQKEGYEGIVRTVDVAAKDPAPIEVQLEKATENPSVAKLDLRSDPAGARVQVDGKDVEGFTPQKFPADSGPHNVQIELPGFEPVNQEVEVLEGLVRVVEMRFTTRMIEIEVSPADSEVTLNGEKRTKISLPRDQELVLLAKHEKHDSIEKTYSVSELDTLKGKIGVRLDPPPLPDQLAKAEGAADDPDLKLPTRVYVKTLQATAPLELVLIKPGAQTIGVESGLYRGELEKQNFVIEKPLYLAVTEVTNAQYAEFAKANAERAGKAWESQAGDGREKHPVLGVSHASAAAFCAWIGGRLPGEYEWEFAARGPANHGFPFPWGLAAIDQTHCNIFFGGVPQAVAVDQLADGATKSGLRHLLGNAAEWCRDNYQAGHGEDSNDPVLKDTFVVRGCSFTKSLGPEIRTTWRAAERPAGAPDVGFRLLFPVDEPVAAAKE